MYVHIGYMIMTSLTFIMFPIFKLINEDSETSDKSIMPFEVDYISLIDVKKHYYIILIHCYICVIAHILIIITVDSILIKYIQHSCAIYHLEHMAGTENEKSDLNSDDKSYWRIISCIRHHKEIIDFVDRIESIYSTYFFLQLGYDMINMSITGTQMVLYADEMFEFIRLTLLPLAQLLHLFFKCWKAQQLIDHSALIRESTCKAAWYRTSVKSKKLIGIMLIKTLETSKLTAGKLLVLCFECFAAKILGDRTTLQESIVLCKLFLRATFCFCVKKGNGAYHSSKGTSSEEDYASHTGISRTY
ncbi:odorant receptor 22a-like [Vespula squamosa]|uniref:Odorant receptor 22a-like n=1 Tax=Vespula squamosa TaxID=30214 RepID=A0ABD2B3J0_VESSQ